MANVPNCFYRVSAKALILDSEKRFLLALEKDGRWEMPGGGLDFGETPHECIKRELHEEAGLVVTSINPKPSYFVTANFAEKENWKANIFYETTVKDLTFTPSDECIELKFFTKEEALKENLFPIIMEFVNQYNPQNH